MIAVVDSGRLYAVTDTDGQDHERSLEVLQRAELQLVVPALVVAEVTYIVGRRLGAQAEARFLRGLASLEVEAPLAEEWSRIAELVDRYADFPLAAQTPPSSPSPSASSRSS